MEACRRYAPLLRPGEHFSHLSAAALYGLPLPLRASAVDVHLTAPLPLTGVRRPGVVSHRTSAGVEVRTRRGLPVSAPGRLFLELAGLATVTLEDLVAVGDALVLAKRMPGGNRQRPLLALDRLKQEVESATGRGCRAARAAVSLVRERVESPMETRLRLLVTAAGLPEPLAGAEVRDRHGALLGYADLMWPQLRLILEYDGDQHRVDRGQYERDIRRLESFTDQDYEVIRVRSYGLLQTPSETADRIHRAYTRRKGASAQ